MQCEAAIALLGFCIHGCARPMVLNFKNNRTSENANCANFTNFNNSRAGILGQFGKLAELAVKNYLPIEPECAVIGIKTSVRVS